MKHLNFKLKLSLYFYCQHRRVPDNDGVPLLQHGHHVLPVRGLQRLRHRPPGQDQSHRRLVSVCGRERNIINQSLKKYLDIALQSLYVIV